MSTTKKVPPPSTKNAPPPTRTPRQAAQLQRRKDRQRRQILTWSAIGAVALLIVVGIVLFVIAQTPKSDIPGVVGYSGLSREHVNTNVNYPQSPPVGGEHSPVWQNCGVYNQPIANENGVHSMEHGAVWITYQPTLASTAVDQLKALVKSGHGYILLSPYPSLSTPVVASAWGFQLKLNDVNDSRLAQFVKAYEQGPQTPEPGAVCSGGLGTPVQ